MLIYRVRKATNVWTTIETLVSLYFHASRVPSKHLPSMRTFNSVCIQMVFV